FFPEREQPANLIFRGQPFRQQHGVEGMQPHLEFGDDAEVTTTTAQGPKEFRILAGGGVNQGAIGQEQGKSLNVVAGQSEAPSKPSGAASENQAGGAGMGDHARRKGQSSFLSRGIDGSQE